MVEGVCYGGDGEDEIEEVNRSVWWSGQGKAEKMEDGSLKMLENRVWCERVEVVVGVNVK